ncbi:MAG: hypothetical protein K2M60_02225 [Lachnospiraceae bacterium]|nr:hypothetical protein [Lachnospiraceae bacterium]MDE6252574.1 hypothetical protein [Lachnospiraceae bacterium]
MQDNVIVPEGNIKVSAEELKKVMDITEKLLNSAEVKEAESDYLMYFQRKYVELPAIRLQEQSMYSFMKRARAVAISEKDMEGVTEIEENYRELREKRIELQKELEKESKNHQIFKEKSIMNGRCR